MGKTREIKVGRKGIEVELEQMSDKAYTEMLIKLLRIAYTNVSEMQQKHAGRDVIYMFNDSFNPETFIYNVVIIVKAAEYEEGKAISQFRVRAKSKMDRHVQQARRVCYESLLMSHIDTSLITWEHTAKLMAIDPEMQKAAKETL